MARVMTLYDNAFSPFARKVRMVLEHKGLRFETLDGLVPTNRAKLAAVNPRVEVPVLVDGEVGVVNSSDIVAYLEHRYPDRPVYPADPAARVAALAWERIADTLLDPILHDVSYSGFGFPDDMRPAGLLEAAREDLAPVYGDIERTLAGREFLCGALSIADFALFPHLTSVRLLDISFDGATHPRLHAWYKRLRQVDVCRADLDRTQAFLREVGPPNLQRPSRLVWRGDRIEWMLARGFHEWFVAEIAAGRVTWPRRD
ncbi:MAG: glutathione S-transferase family protein [Hyphomicrobiaceae bacterium]|nr:MAG: glutathione S-transferase family protein [Hyphomicrobiaceae bacterium]